MKLGKLFKAFVNVVELPIAVTKDVLTLGGITTEHSGTYTKEKIEETEENLDDIFE